MRIMAIDLGKSKSVCCVYDSASGEHSFETIKTRVSVLAQRLKRFVPDRVVIETCPLAGWVISYEHKALSWKWRIRRTRHGVGKT